MSRADEAFAQVSGGFRRPPSTAGTRDSPFLVARMSRDSDILAVPGIARSIWEPESRRQNGEVSRYPSVRAARIGT